MSENILNIVKQHFVKNSMKLEKSSTMPRSVHVGFVVDEVALGLVFLSVLRFYTISITPPMRHIHSCNILGMDNGPVSSPIPEGQSLTTSEQYRTRQKKLLMLEENKLGRTVKTRNSLAEFSQGKVLGLTEVSFIIPDLTEVTDNVVQ
jgi:hypothetical protein